MRRNWWSDTLGKLAVQPAAAALRRAQNAAAFIDGTPSSTCPPAPCWTTPIHLLFVADGRARRAPCSPRNVVVLGASARGVAWSRATWRWPRASYLTNAVTEVVWPPSARLEHTAGSSARASRPSTWPRSRCDQERDSHLPLVLLRAWARRSPGHTSAPPGSTTEDVEALLYGLYLGRGRPAVDNQTAIEHDHAQLPQLGGLQGHPRRHARTACSTARCSCTRRRRRPTPSRPTRTCCSRDDGQGRHQAAARDLRRRREVHPRRHGGQPRRVPLFYCQSRGIPAAEAQTPPHLRVRGGSARGDPEPPGGGSSRGLDAGVAAEGGAAGQQGSEAGIGVTMSAEHRPAAPQPRGPARRQRRSARDFPILGTRVDGKPLVYLDNAATAQKPRVVIDAVRALLAERQRQHPPRRALPERAGHAGVRRGARRRSRGSSTPRLRTKSSSPAAPPRRSTSWPRATGGRTLRPGDEILHHRRWSTTRNIVPWQLVAEQTGAVVRAIPITDAGELDLEAYRPAARTDAPASSRVVHISNALGTINPVAEMTPDGARGRRRRAGGRRPGGAPPAGGRAGARLRLLRLLRAQGVRAHRHRGALGTRVAARGDAALAGRRRHDRHRELRRDHLRAACPPSSRRARRLSPR